MRYRHLNRRELLKTAGAVATGAGVVTQTETEQAAEGPATAEKAVESYFAAIDVCDRERAHELLADSGELGEWGEMEIAWYGAFGVTLLDFEPIEQSEDAVTATLEVDVAGEVDTFEYEVRRSDDEGWRLWDTTGGIRS